MTTSNANLPDIEQLTRLANEFFTALPCDGSLVNAAVQGVVPQSLPLPTSISNTTQMTDLAYQHSDSALDASLLNLANQALS
jgi:hypothetical protein